MLIFSHDPMRKLLKNIVETIPYSIAKYLVKVPYEVRLGSEYSRFSNLLTGCEKDDVYVVEQFNRIFQFAKDAFPFYEQLYKEAGVYNLVITSISDIELLPIVTKPMLRESLAQFSGAMKLNTGGTCGAPFEFFVDKGAFPREWAHMHCI